MKERGRKREREILSVLLVTYVYTYNSKIKTTLDINFSVSIEAIYKENFCNMKLFLKNFENILTCILHFLFVWSGYP